MGLIVLEEPWRRQPDRPGVDIDWSSPLASGLEMLYVPWPARGAKNVLIKPVSVSYQYESGQKYVPTRAGMGHAFDANDESAVGWGTNVANSGNSYSMTHFAIAVPLSDWSTSTTDGSIGMSCYGYTHQLSFGTRTDNCWSASRGNIVDTVPVKIGVPNVLVCTSGPSGSTGCKFWVDGRYIGQGPNVYVDYRVNYGSISCGRGGNFVLIFSGYSSRAWSNAEIANFTANPWQLFAP